MLTVGLGLHALKETHQEMR